MPRIYIYVVYLCMYVCRQNNVIKNKRRNFYQNKIWFEAIAVYNNDLNSCICMSCIYYVYFVRMLIYVWKDIQSTLFMVWNLSFVYLGGKLSLFGALVCQQFTCHLVGLLDSFMMSSFYRCFALSAFHIEIMLSI